MYERSHEKAIYKADQANSETYCPASLVKAIQGLTYARPCLQTFTSAGCHARDAYLEFCIVEKDQGDKGQYGASHGAVHEYNTSTSASLYNLICLWYALQAYTTKQSACPCSWACLSAITLSSGVPSIISNNFLAIPYLKITCSLRVAVWDICVHVFLENFSSRGPIRFCQGTFDRIKGLR